MKTYILAPNFSFQPNGSIEIGNVVADPFRPTKTLGTLDRTGSSTETVTTTELHSSIRHTQSRAGHGSIWAQFLQTAGAHVGAVTSTDLTTSYEFDSLDTIQLRFDPTEEQVTPLLQNSKVQAAMNAGLFGRQPVYIITGMKIARGFSLTDQVTTKLEGGTGIGLPLTDQVSLGFDVGHTRGNEVERSFRSGNDVVFAYQLHKVVVKGVRTKTTSVDVYAPKSALLHNEDRYSADAVDVTAATADDLKEILVGDENLQLNVSSITDGIEPCMCIVYKDTSGR
ncbi:hypothetical protein LTR17_009621 [Elasticomyces elasticus]|nr:hypothetical protein LTR17_009621 [Elasticomyces elasticus]